MIKQQFLDGTILKIDRYRDGGTISIELNNKEWCIDNRIGSLTKGQFYDGYPKRDNSNNVEYLQLILGDLLGKISGISYDHYLEIIKLRKDNNL